MRNVWCLPVAVLLLTPAPALAQNPPQAGAAPASDTPAVTVGEIDFGGRLTSIAGDPGRYQRLRDLRSGPTLDRFRYTRDRETWVFDARVDHVGYRDQRYLASFERVGRFEASVAWDQTPLFHGDATRSPFRETGPGIFRLDDGLQAQGASIAVYNVAVERFDTRSRRDLANVKFAYDVTRELSLLFGATSTRRNGEQPWAASFGFSNANEVPVTLDHRTHDVTTAAEWSNQRGMVRVAYDGSWFDNKVETLIWDNPLRFTDQTHPNAYSTGDGSSQGRMALWPDSTAHTVSVSGSVALPARSRAFAYVSVGTWLQDAELLPHTINTAIAPIPLPRDSAEAEARITSMNYRFTSRPARSLWLSGQYRLYDYDNRTPHFPLDRYVRLDGNVATSATGGSEPFGYTRHFVDLDASYAPFRFAAFRAGYGRERDDRTFRVFERTADHVVRGSIDSTGLAWGSLRLQYDHSVRTGDGLDEQVLSDIGEQISLRQFDISDRTRDRVSAIVQVVPTAFLGVSASLAVGRERRPDAAFGLQDNDLRAFSVGLDVAPGEVVTTTLSYGFEHYATRQQSRQANPGAQFNDPRRDWWTDMNEDVHDAGVHVDIPGLARRVAVSAGYDYVGSRAKYVYVLTPDSTLTPPQQLPPVWNTFHVGTADLRYTLTRQLGIGVGYRFDRYDVEDFALSPGTLNSPLIPGFVNLMSQWRPYEAHTGSVRMLYSW
jgi:MtrB/PioB family decaheme-associated outer membrane protein